MIWLQNDNLLSGLNLGSQKTKIGDCESNSTSWDINNPVSD